jgi:hypothetical protein
MRNGHPESGHDGVARELLDDTPVRLDAARDHLEIAVQALADHLGIGARDQRGRVDDVGEEYGRDLALHPSMVGGAG